MIYLLDTHALWQHAADSDELSARAASLLDEAQLQELCVLDVSLYELARHMAVGRIEVEDPLRTLAIIGENYPIMHSDARIAWTSTSMDWPKRNDKGQHLDPADRAIFAAALLHKLTIISADREMHHHAPRAGVSILW